MQEYHDSDLADELTSLVEDLRLLSDPSHPGEVADKAIADILRYLEGYLLISADARRTLKHTEYLTRQEPEDGRFTLDNVFHESFEALFVFATAGLDQSGACFWCVIDFMAIAQYSIIASRDIEMRLGQNAYDGFEDDIDHVGDVLLEHAYTHTMMLISLSDMPNAQSRSLDPIMDQVPRFTSRVMLSKSTAGIGEPRVIQADGLGIYSHRIALPDGITVPRILVGSLPEVPHGSGQPQTANHDISHLLHIPLLSQTYTMSPNNTSEPTIEGTIKMRMISASVARYLTEFEVFNFPVFSLITNGTTGRLCYAYMDRPKSKQDACILSTTSRRSCLLSSQPPVGLIVERNVGSFDMTKAIDVVCLAIIVRRIFTEHREALKAKLDAFGAARGTVFIA